MGVRPWNRGCPTTYDIQEFLSWVPQIPGSALEFWISSAANPLRGKTRRTLTKVAIDAEYHDRPASWGAKERDTLRSHLSIRREIIRQCGVNLDQAIVERLAVGTRGLHESDIHDAVQGYLSSGALPRPDHPTKTCDPYTGNWAERLMDPFKLADSLRVAGLQAQALPGYWADEPKRPVKRFLKTLTNALMSRSGPAALRLASYYVLRGRKFDPAGSSS